MFKKVHSSLHILNERKNQKKNCDQSSQRIPPPHKPKINFNELFSFDIKRVDLSCNMHLSKLFVHFCKNTVNGVKGNAITRYLD